MKKIFDSRYLNQTYKLATAQKEIVDKIDTVKTDLETIDSLDSKYKLNAKNVYIKTLDLSKALAENKRLADLEEKLEAGQAPQRPRKRLRENARKKSVNRRKLRSRQSVRQKKRSAKLQKLRKHRKPPQKSNGQNLSPKWVR